MMDNGKRETIGLIGVGLMGFALAERLLDAGYPVLGYDIDPDRRMNLRGRGGTAAAEAKDVVAACRRIFLSLPTSDIVWSLLREIELELSPGQIIIDTTTGDVGSAIRAGEMLELRQVAYLDATISGSSQQARQGEVVVMAGGPKAEFDACRDLFQLFARRFFHLGPYGAGSQMKLVSNLVLGLNRAALAEGLAFAQTLGLDLHETLLVLKESMAYSRIMDTKGEKMINGDFIPQARLSQHHKDVHLILETGAASGANLPFSAVHHQVLEQAESMGLGDLDNSAVFCVFISQDRQGS